MREDGESNLALSIIRAGRFGSFVSHSCFQLQPMILLADNEDADHTARMRRLIFAYAVGICPKTRFCMVHMIFIKKNVIQILHTSANGRF